jgi:putative aminopeptidase FrvX
LNFELLKKLCALHAPSGSESAMKDFLLDYVERHKKDWKTQPEVIYGDGFQDCVILAFGQPRTAVFAHIDSIGFTVRYDNKLVPIGGPEAETGFELTGEDTKGKINTKIVADLENGLLCCDFQRPIDRGTNLVFKCDFRETEQHIQSCYLDNRLGVFVALKLAETLENGLLVFSCYEEHGGGTVPFLMKYMWERWQIKSHLICDITWVTEGVHLGKGVAISMRDSRIPRKAFLDKVIRLATEHQLHFQLEVEASGGSDGRELQASPYPVDWVFIGAAEENVHSPNEKVHKTDVQDMLIMYQLLMEKL